MVKLATFRDENSRGPLCFIILILQINLRDCENTRKENIYIRCDCAIEEKTKGCCLNCLSTCDMVRRHEYLQCVKVIRNFVVQFNVYEYREN